MRTLWYVPTLHTTDETFVGSELARTSATLRRALEKMDQHTLQAWKRLDRKLDTLIRAGDIRPKRLSVFCDGLPHPLSKFPKFLSKSTWKGNTPTYAMMMRLRAKGAAICGTESPGLLGAYGAFVMARLDNPKLQKDKDTDQDLLRLRDVWIADHISQNLADGRDAILFMGAIHQVDTYVRAFAPDIRIKYLRTILPKGYKP